MPAGSKLALSLPRAASATGSAGGSKTSIAWRRSIAAPDERGVAADGLDRAADDAGAGVAADRRRRSRPGRRPSRRGCGSRSAARRRRRRAAPSLGLTEMRQTARSRAAAKAVEVADRLPAARPRLRRRAGPACRSRRSAARKRAEPIGDRGGEALDAQQRAASSRLPAPAGGRRR